ncbi:MAG TPA: transcription antitermination factor NusB [Thermomicrobiales bacterium]|nr:transcription antitermination factor NusB [Thermomicrobiales bacterium]
MSPDPSDRPEAPQPEQSPKPARKRRPGKPRTPMPDGFSRRAYVDMSASRHQSRIIAMQALYERDLTAHDLEDILAPLRGEEQPVLPESALETADEDETGLGDVPRPVADRAITLVNGVIANQDEIDPIIEKAAPQFPIPQIAAIDRNVLRLAVFELLKAPDVPYKVVINEAVEIAKRFGGPNSGRFVNGVLGTISRDLPEDRKSTAG